MLREVQHVRQIPNDYFRRWFSDESFDLYVWYNPDESIHGFQICYDLPDQAKALTWKNGGFSCHDVDTGDESPLADRSPILTPSSDAAKIKDRFCAVDWEIPADIRDYVRGKLSSYELKS